MAGARPTWTGYLRQMAAGNSSSSKSDAPTPATFKGHILVTFDPTQALAGTGKYLPNGAIPVGVTGLGGGTGGISPTVDLSLAGGAAGGLTNELPADATTAEVVTGAELLIALTADTEIEAGVGASAATGGTFSALVSYIMPDDGVRND